MGKLLFCADRSANTPFAMYLVVSVLPSSITSGALPPAIVASNLVRWSVHVWYWTSTFTPGCSFWKSFVAWATVSAQPFWASFWSHTVIDVAFDAPLAVDAATASATATIVAATRRIFIAPPPGRRRPHATADWIRPLVTGGRLA